MTGMPIFMAREADTARRPLVAPSAVLHTICTPYRVTSSGRHPMIRLADVMFLLQALALRPATEPFISCFTLPQVSPLCCPGVQDRPPRDHGHVPSLSGQSHHTNDRFKWKILGKQKRKITKVMASRQQTQSVHPLHFFSSRWPLVMGGFVCIPSRRNVVVHSPVARFWY